MRIAFYAPLKSPAHPVPSGDRRIARALLQALALGGHETKLVSSFRSFDGRGEAVRQARLAALGDRLAGRLAARMRKDRRPDVWFTYHVHHKAPDLLGPAVSRALGIPYVIAEASIAPRQRDGPWAAGHARARDAIRTADLIVFLNPADIPAVRNVRSADAPQELLAPFIDVEAFAGPSMRSLRIPTETTLVRLVTVAMMRYGAKLASYRTLAAALSSLRDLDWKLEIIGDGPARKDVDAAFAELGDRVALAGTLPATEIAARLQQSDLFVWPAIDEAIGIVFLEAQACGVPVVGAATPGVAAVVSAGQTGLLAPVGDAAAFAAAVRRLVTDGELRGRMSGAAFVYVRQHHDLPRAAAQLDAMLRGVVERHRITA